MYISICFCRYFQRSSEVLENMRGYLGDLAANLQQVRVASIYYFMPQREKVKFAREDRLVKIDLKEIHVNV